jgi:hypothetical protein
MFDTAEEIQRYGRHKQETDTEVIFDTEEEKQRYCRHIKKVIVDTVKIQMSYLIQQRRYGDVVDI